MCAPTFSWAAPTMESLHTTVIVQPSAAVPSPSSSVQSPVPGTEPPHGCGNQTPVPTTTADSALHGPALQPLIIQSTLQSSLPPALCRFWSLSAQRVPVLRPQGPSCRPEPGTHVLQTPIFPPAAVAVTAPAAALPQQLTLSACHPRQALTLITGHPLTRPRTPSSGPLLSPLLPAAPLCGLPAQSSHLCLPFLPALISCLGRLRPQVPSCLWSCS